MPIQINKIPCQFAISFICASFIEANIKKTKIDIIGQISNIFVTKGILIGIMCVHILIRQIKHKHAENVKYLSSLNLFIIFLNIERYSPFYYLF